MLYFCLLFTFVLTNMKIFHALGNNCPQSLMAIETHVLSAAVSIWNMQSMLRIFQVNFD